MGVECGLLPPVSAVCSLRGACRTVERASPLHTRRRLLELNAQGQAEVAGELAQLPAAVPASKRRLESAKRLALSLPEKLASVGGCMCGSGGGSAWSVVQEQGLHDQACPAKADQHIAFMSCLPNLCCRGSACCALCTPRPCPPCWATA